MSKNQALLWSACLTAFFSAFMSNAINVAIPAIADTYSITPENVPLAVSAYVITVTAFIFPSIALSNRLGIQKTFALGALSTSLAALVVPFAPTFNLFLLGRIFQGLFNAIIFVTNLALVSYYIEKEKRAYYIGLTVASVYLGISLSPSIGGFLTDLIGWQIMFYITAFGSFLSYLFVKKVPQDPPVSKKYPLKRMALCASSFTLIFICLSFFKELPKASYILLFGIVLFTIYLYSEHKSKDPLLPIPLLLNNKVLSFNLLSAICNYMSTFAIALLLSMHLQLILGFSASETGLILMLQPLMQCLLSPIAGKLSNNINRHLLVFIGLLLCSISTFVYSLLEPTTSLIIINLAQVLGGIGFGLFSAPNTDIIMGSVSKTKLSLVGGLTSLARNFGMSSCMAIVTVVISLYLSAAPDTTLYIRELNFTISRCFVISTFCGVIGMVFCILGAYYAKHKTNL